MNQRFLVLKATASKANDGSAEYVCVAELLCERSESRQCAKDVIEEDGTFYCVPLGDKIDAHTTRVFEGVKSTRAKTDKPATKAKAPRKAIARGLPKATAAPTAE